MKNREEVEKDFEAAFQDWINIVVPTVTDTEKSALKVVAFRWFVEGRDRTINEARRLVNDKVEELPVLLQKGYYREHSY